MKSAAFALAGIFAPRREVVEVEDPYEWRWVEDAPAQEAVVIGQCPLVVDDLCPPGCDGVENGWNGDSALIENAERVCSNCASFKPPGAVGCFRAALITGYDPQRCDEWKSKT